MIRNMSERSEPNGAGGMPIEPFPAAIREIEPNKHVGLIAIMATR